MCELPLLVLRMPQRTSVGSTNAPRVMGFLEQIEALGPRQYCVIKGVRTPGRFTIHFVETIFSPWNPVVIGWFPRCLLDPISLLMNSPRPQRAALRFSTSLQLPLLFLMVTVPLMTLVSTAHHLGCLYYIYIYKCVCRYLLIYIYI